MLEVVPSLLSMRLVDDEEEGFLSIHPNVFEAMPLPNPLALPTLLEDGFLDDLVLAAVSSLVPIG